jgi:hypothetical protein
MQQTFKKLQDDWQKKWIKYRLKAILVICFLAWTPLLITETLQIQHSCHPLVDFTHKLSAECNSFPGLLPPAATPVPSNLNPGIVGIGVAEVAAIVGAPVAVAAGIGILVWLLGKGLF